VRVDQKDSVEAKTLNWREKGAPNWGGPSLGKMGFAAQRGKKKIVPFASTGAEGVAILGAQEVLL